MRFDSQLNAWTLRAPTLTQLMAQAVRGHLAVEEPDAVLNIETHLYNVLLIADSCEYELDVGKHLWLNRQRWSRLVREYVPAQPLQRFLNQCNEILCGKARDGATANLLFRDPDRYEKKHRWGGCLMGATFRGDRKGRPTLTFFSRTTYMGYMGLMDAGIASNFAIALATEGPVQFRWHVASMQLHCFKTLPYIYSQPDLMRRLEWFAAKDSRLRAATPTWRHVTKWYKKVLQAYAEHGVHMLDVEKYGPFRRIKRRWLEYKGYLKKHVPPSCSIATLGWESAE